MKTSLIRPLILTLFIITILLLCVSCIPNLPEKAPFDEELFNSLISDEYMYIDDTNEMMLTIEYNENDKNSDLKLTTSSEEGIVYYYASKYSESYFTENCAILNVFLLNDNGNHSHQGQYNLTFTENSININFDGKSYTLHKTEKTSKFYLPVSVFESKPYDKDQLTDNTFEYSLNKDKNSYSISAKSVSLSGQVIIPSEYNGLPITAIGNSDENEFNLNGFSGCNNLESVIIPDSVKTIGNKAFSECTSLLSIDLSDNISTIGYGAFAGCKNLEQVNLGSNCTIIPQYAFAGCMKLKEIKNSDFVNVIEEYAFYYCKSIETLSFKNVTTIGTRAFENCKNIRFFENLDNLENIGEKAFIFCCKLERFDFSDKIKTIPTLLFYEDYNLNTISFGDNIERINDKAFYYTDIRNLYIKDISKFLKTVYNGSNYFYLSNDWNLYINNELIEDLIIPDTVTTFGDMTLSGCSSIKSITFTGGLVKVRENAFSYCDNLSSVKFSNKIKTIETDAFNNCYNLTDIEFVEGLEKICYRAFKNCENLKEVKFPASLKEIEKHAFDSCVNLTDITFNEGIKLIGYKCFSNCTSLKVLNLPKSLTVIEEKAFENCNNLTTVTLYDVTYDKKAVFSNYDNIDFIIKTAD